MGWAWVGGRAPPVPPLPTHLRVGLGEQFNDTGVWRGHHTVSVDLDDSVSHANAPTLSDATPEETADLTGQEGATMLRGLCLGLPTPHHSALGWGLTMPSSTQNPSCSRAWGR